MKDAFGKEITLDSIVLYTTGTTSPIFVIGKIVKLYQKDPKPLVWAPDKVMVELIKASANVRYSKNPIIYASNVMVIEKDTLTEFLTTKKQDGRIGKDKTTQVDWESSFKPGDLVNVKHYKKRVLAQLIRQKHSPRGAWVCSKCIDFKWTKESVCNEYYDGFEKRPDE